MHSYWEKSINSNQDFNQLKENIEVDVCIIGGGLTGISAGYYLSKKGKKVAILEKDRICSHTSGHTTGKVTSQHGLFYNYLIQSQGEEYAKKYLDINEQAIKNIKEIIDKEKIKCDFKEENAYVFTRNKDSVLKIKQEVEAVNKLEKNAKFQKNLKLPFEIEGAIEFEKQAQFHPIKYAYGLCDVIIKNNGKIYENTKVVDTKRIDDGYIIYTEEQKVKAKYLVMATRYPIKVFPGYYFIKMYQSSSYALVVDTKTDLMDGIYISSESPTISLRTIYEKDKKLLLIVGYDYKTGRQEDKNGYKELEKFVKTIYPESKIVSKWIAEDCISLDKIPYIGEFSKILPNMYVATGFNKWGMTFSNISANLITDDIFEEENSYSKLFYATRVKPIKNKDEMKNMLKESMQSIVINKFKEPNNPICTHLGCELSFNPIENTWDCPCHGSRFTKNGKVIESPSIKNIED